MRSLALEGKESVLVQYLFEDKAHQIILAKKMHTGAGTKQKLQERVVGHKTPSTICDELFDKGGGMDFKSSSDLPWSTDQIKYEHQKICRKSDVDEMATLLQMTKEKQYIRIFSGHLNLEWLFSQTMYCKM